MLRLSEKPVEWIKFTAVNGVAFNGALGWLWWNQALHGGVCLTCSGAAVAATLTAIIQPRWFRRFYRCGMLLSFQIGQIMGKVILTLFFILLLTPIGLLMRLLGKDLLQLKRKTGKHTYWHEAKDNREFDRMF
jgi:hypothetical protein